MHVRDLIKNLLFAGKESSLQACNHRYNYAKEETNAGTMRTTGLVKGSTC